MDRRKRVIDEHHDIALAVDAVGDIGRRYGVITAIFAAAKAAPPLIASASDAATTALARLTRNPFANSALPLILV